MRLERNHHHDDNDNGVTDFPLVGASEEDWSSDTMKASDGSRRHRHDESVLSSATAQQGPSPSQQQRPWYASGGMHVNVVGILLAINAAPFLVLLCNDRLSPVHRHVFLAVWLSLCAASAVSSHTVHCVVIVPTGLASLWLVVVLDHPLRLLAVSLALGITKINICMSVCLHRYAAHAAFKCGPCTSFALCVVGCLANQGGPLWWASKHRCHHKLRTCQRKNARALSHSRR